jgi:ABC-type branched-subunit amino acid transport system substrate-binding protein
VTSTIAAALIVVAAGCSSSSKSPHPTGAASKPITIGVIADLTGLASTDDTTVAQGVAAGVGLAAKQGYNIRYVVTDSATSPATALSDAKRLVDEDHVFAVVLISALGFSAAPYLASRGIPVVGAAIDSTEWITDKNMFSILGTQDYTHVYSTQGLAFKLIGVTNLASVGYNISPSSSESAQSTALASQHEGIQVGYLNDHFPFGSTNVGPIVLAMKAKGIDGFSGSIEENTEFAVITALRQQGVHLKGALMATGYGGDLAVGGPGATQAAQGVYFLTGFEPVEMHTPATDKLQSALKTYSHVSGDPTFAEYLGYLSVDALVQGLQKAGPNPTQAAVVNAMGSMTAYDGAGLYGDHTVAFDMADRGKASGADNCYWLTKYEGTTFQLIQGGDPICGAEIPGLKVSPSS